MGFFKASQPRLKARSTPMEDALFSAAMTDRAYLRDIARGKDDFDPYAQLNVEDQLRSRLGIESGREFSEAQNQLNAAGGATTGQLRSAGRKISQDFTGKMSDLASRIQFARAQLRSDRASSALGSLGSLSQMAPTGTLTGEQPPQYLQYLSALGGAAGSYFGAKSGAKAEK